MWRHHKARDGIYLVPKNLGIRGDINNAAEIYINAHLWEKLLELELNPWHFPHEWGASIRMKYLRKTRGYDETLWLEPCDVELFCRLNLCYHIVFAEDVGHITVHRNVPGAKRGGEGHQNPDHVFNPFEPTKNLDGWGIPPDEMVMTKAMKEVLGK